MPPAQRDDDGPGVNFRPGPGGGTLYCAWTDPATGQPCGTSWTPLQVRATGRKGRNGRDLRQITFPEALIRLHRASHAIEARNRG